MIIENKVKSVDRFNKEGEHKIEGIPNLYLRVGKSNKVFRYKSKRCLTLVLKVEDWCSPRSDNQRAL